MLKILQRLKTNIGGIITLLTLIILFGVVFVGVGIVELNQTFLVELTLVSILAIQTRFFWYTQTEINVLLDPELIKAKDVYDNLVDASKINITELDECLKEMDEENYNEFVKGYMGHVTPENSGQRKYDKMMAKARRKADRIKKLRSSDILTRGDTKVLYDSKNYMGQEKFTYQIVSSVVSVAITIVLASIAFNNITLSWESAFRYITYVWSIISAAIMTVFTAKRKTVKEFRSHLSRLQFILDKFLVWREHYGGETNVIYRENE